MFAVLFIGQFACQGVGSRSPGTFEHAPLGLEHFRCCSMSACDFCKDRIKSLVDISWF